MRAPEFLSTRASRVAIVALIAAGAAGCSADTTRFNSSPYAQARAPQPEVTGSVPAQPSNRVVSQPLPQVAAQPAPVASRPVTVASGQLGKSGGGPGLASYQPAPTPHYQTPAEVTGSIHAPRPAAPHPIAAAPVAAAPVAAPAPAQQWTWDGGKPIVVGSGDTLDVIAHRYGVPVAAIMKVNNLSSPTAIVPGQHLVIPRYASTAAHAVAPQPVAVAPAPAIVHPIATMPAQAPAPIQAAAPQPQPSGDSYVHTVGAGETLLGVSKRYHVTMAAIARANNMQPYSKLQFGQRLVIPGVHPKTAAAAPAVQQPVPAQPQQKIAANEIPGTPSARVVTPSAEQPKQESSTKTVEATGALPSFRWPVRGRIIVAFGPKPNGQQNDGINLAVPEGTAVKASDDGVVAYAGNELKGYGNLVLVRHSNGYVTAYAHASELLVKRGDHVKRGQDIAKAGQTGSVDAPQLHFEIRRGATPVDPMKFLGGA